MSVYDDWKTTPDDETGDPICGECYSSNVYLIEDGKVECLERGCRYIGPAGDPEDARDAAADYAAEMKGDERREAQ